MPAIISSSRVLRSQRGGASLSWTMPSGRRQDGNGTGSRAQPSGEEALEALVQLDLGLPAQHLLGARDVGLTHLRVVDGQRLEDDLRLRACYTDDRLGELEQRHLMRVPDVDREVLTARSEEVEPADLVVHVAKGAGLRAVAEDGQRLVLERLADERRDCAPVVG